MRAKTLTVSAEEFNRKRSTLLQKLRFGLCKEVAITYRGLVVAKMVRPRKVTVVW